MTPPLPGVPGIKKDSAITKHAANVSPKKTAGVGDQKMSGANKSQNATAGVAQRRRARFGEKDMNSKAMSRKPDTVSLVARAALL